MVEIMNHSSNKKITVFTSSYSHGKYLPKAIESVLNQDFTDFEYILIDDGSIDDTLTIMERYSRLDERIRVIELPKQPTKGPILNKSVKEAKGDFWVWAPADDILSPTLLSDKLKFSEQVGQDSIIYSDYWIINDKGQITKKSNLKTFTQKTLTKAVWETTNLFGFTGIWIPINILREVPIPEHIKYSEDFYWLIKTTLLGYKYNHLKKRLYYKRKHSDSVTSKNYKAVMADVTNIRNELKKEFNF